MHLPHDGRALSHRFFFLRQLRQTREDRGTAGSCSGDVVPGDLPNLVDIDVSSSHCVKRPSRVPAITTEVMNVLSWTCGMPGAVFTEVVAVMAYESLKAVGTLSTVAGTLEREGYGSRHGRIPVRAYEA